MRYVVAYNKDFDLYVKEYIKAAGLPVDSGMNWSKYFSKLSTKLISRDPEVQDEAFHQIIIKTLVERSVLADFPSAIKKYPPAVQALPLEKQVTEFLKKTFAWRIKEANHYIQRYIFQEDTDSMFGTEDGEEGGPSVNMLDREEFATKGVYDLTEADIEVNRFRRGFSDYLHNKFKESTADQYLTLFDVVYEEVKASEDAPRAVDVLPEWFREVGNTCLHCGGSGYHTRDTRTQTEIEKGYRSKLERVECAECEGKGATEGKSVAWFKTLFTKLPTLIDSYIKTHLDELKYKVHPFLEIMRHIGRKIMEQGGTPVHASIGDLKLAEDDSNDREDGGVEFNVPAALDMVSEMAVLASPQDPSNTALTTEKVKTQDVPEAIEVAKKCFPEFTDVVEEVVRGAVNNDFSHSYVVKDHGRIIGGYFLGQAQLPAEVKGSEAYVNKRGIEGVALFLLPEYRGKGIGHNLRDIPLHSGADYIWGQHYEELNNLDPWKAFGRKHVDTIDGVHFTLMDLTTGGKLAAQWEVPTCKLCGESKEVRDCPPCKSKFCPECLFTHHSNNPSHSLTAAKKKVR